MSLFEIKAEIPTTGTNELDAALLELQEPGWTICEDVIIAKAWVIGIFPSEAEARARWVELVAVRPELATARLEARTLVDADWRDSYKRHFRAWQFGRLHWVPVWEREQFTAPQGASVLWLDPGLAFGTGNHETTRLCVERLVALVEERGPLARVIDAGCGSGILALSAARLGCANVSGFDNDPEAVRVSIENAALNHLEGTVVFSVADLVAGLGGQQAGLIFANILANVLMENASSLVAAVAPSGTLVLSGILTQERDRVVASFSSLCRGWPIDSRSMGDWSDVVISRPN